MNRKYLIGEVAKSYDVSNDTLRYYDKMNIVSPSKDEVNGYRYYTYEDIVKLSYVILLRRLEMPLTTIKELINDCDIEKLKQVMENQESIIDKKISDLETLKNTVINYKNDLYKVTTLLDEFNIVKSPCFMYKIINDEIEDSIVKEMKELESRDGISNTVWSYLINKEAFGGNDFENDYISIACGIKKENFSLEIYDDLKSFQYDKCLHTIIKSTIDISNNELKTIKGYMEQHKLKICANVMMQYIGFESKNGVAFDYIELWIPIE